MNIAILLYLPDHDVENEYKLVMRFREDWRTVADDDAIEVLAALEKDFDGKNIEMGPRCMLEYLESTLSNSLLLSDRIRVTDGGDYVTILNKLFRSAVPGSALTGNQRRPV